MNKTVTKEHISQRAEILLAALLLLTKNSGKTMESNLFKKHIQPIPNMQRLFTCLKQSKIVGLTRKGMSSYTTYSSEIHPNIQMCERLILCSQQLGRDRQAPKKVEKKIPITLCDKKILSFDKKEDLQSQLIAELNRVKDAFEKQCDSKVEILIEITSTTTIQI